MPEGDRTDLRRGYAIVRENVRTAVEFAKKIEGFDGISSIILFGSVARGEDTADSDIDIAVIHDLEDDAGLMEKVNEHKPEKVQITFLKISDLPREMELVSALSGDGLLLHGRPVVIQQKNLELLPKILIAYSLKGLPQKEKVKLNRALYGSVSKSGKYTTETKGVTAEPGVEKLGPGVLLADRKKAGKLMGTLRRFGAKVKQKQVWCY